MRQWLALGLCLLLPAFSAYAEPVPRDVVQATVDAAGGEGKILKLFRMKEQLSIGADPEKVGHERITVVEPPAHWWLGKKDRVTKDMEPAIYLIWGWTLGALVDPKSKLDAIADVEHDGRPAYGIRISESIAPAMDCYFDRDTKRLVRIDWRADKHVFSDWRKTGGTAYPAKCIGYKLQTGKHWYHTEIIEIEPLDDLPAELTR